jgi:hypothetical protein
MWKLDVSAVYRVGNTSGIGEQDEEKNMETQLCWFVFTDLRLENTA